jgi:hypothetical protein
VFRITPGKRCTDWARSGRHPQELGVQAEARGNGYGYSIWPDSMSASIVL